MKFLATPLALKVKTADSGAWHPRWCVTGTVRLTKQQWFVVTDIYSVAAAQIHQSAYLYAFITFVRKTSFVSINESIGQSRRY